jgi:hypothetical protein
MNLHIHGLWILGTFLLFLGAITAIYWELEPLGSTWWSNLAAIVLVFILFALAGICWISSAVNARHEEER